MNNIATDKVPPNAVVLPCEADQFRDFIAGLLGKPQAISRVLDGPFEVTRADAENLFHLLSQRISSQNEATLIQFTARIVYKDNSSVSVNSFEEFKSYNEVRPLTSVALHLSWTWLIRFRAKQHPEKQQIDVSFLSANNSEIEDLLETRRRNLLSWGANEMRIRIAHTDRTWGTDIEALLAGHLAMLRTPETPLRRFVYKNSGRIGLAVFSFVLACALIAGYAVTNAFVDSYLSTARTFTTLDSQTFEAVSRKLDFMLAVIASGMWTRYAFYVVVLFVVSLLAAILVGATVGTYAGRSRPSFVLLTKNAEFDRTLAIRRYERGWWTFAGSLFGALGISVLGNFAFYRIMQLWSLP